MDKTNSKILTVSFALAAALVGMTLSLLLRALAGAFGVIAGLMGHDLVKHGVPVAVALILFGVFQFHPKLLGWANEVVVEIRKVVWPTQKQTSLATIQVIIMVLISCAIVAIFDLLSGSILKYIMNL